MHRAVASVIVLWAAAGTVAAQVQWKLLPPVATRIDPTSAAPGATIDVYGRNLNPQAYVGPRVVFETRPTFATQSALAISNTHLRVVVPRGSGTIQVHVETAGGNSNAMTFVYKTPTIASLSPASGGGDQIVTIIGQGFGVKQALDSSSFIKFGDSLAEPVQWDDQRIVVKAPTDFGTGTNTNILLGLLVCATGFGTTSEAAKLILDLSLPGCDDLFTSLVERYQLVESPGFLERQVQAVVHTAAGTSNQRTFTYRVQAEFQGTSSQGGSSPAGGVVLADLLLSNDGKETLLAPFLMYAGGQYTPLPDGVQALQLSREDYGPQGIPNPTSPRVLVAIKQSVLNKVKNFDVYRDGKKIGSFPVSSVTVTWAGGDNIKVVGKGIPTGFQLQGPGIAITGPASHAGFWPSTGLSSAQQKQLLSQALAMIPATVPGEWVKESQGQPTLTPALVGKPIITEVRPIAADVFRFKRDGNTSVFFEVMVDMKTSLGPFASADVSFLDNYDETTHSWKRVLTCRASWELQAIPSWDNGCSLKDVLDINGDGVAELILGRGHDETSDIEIYELSGGELRLISAIKGWTGS